MRGIRVGSVLGFEIRIDYSWFVIVFLILWSFSAGVFPERFPELTGGEHLAMGVVGAALFFASLLAHELSHSVVARARGIPVDAITLFVFGGMAHTREEAATPEDELAIAGVGPLCSLVIGALFGGLWWLGERQGWPVTVTGVAQYLGFLNVLLAGFNLLPGFPLDGGRLFRALVWKVTGNLTKATRWASNGGRAFGWVLMGLGALQVLAGAVVGGLWLVFIGWFLRTAAEVSFRQHLLRGVLSVSRVFEVMTPRPSTVSPELTLEELVDDRLLHEPYQAYPVVENGSIRGIVTLGHVQKTPRERWSDTRVADVMDRPQGIVVDREATVSDVLDRMSEGGANRVLVVDEGELVGIISTSDLSRWMQKQQALRELRDTDAVQESEAGGGGSGGGGAGGS